MFSRSVMSDSLQHHGLQHPRLPCPSLSPEGCSKSCPLSQWCHPTISSSVALFSSCPQSFPASGSFLTSQLFTSSGQSVRASALTSVLQMNIQGWFPLGLADLISLQSMGLSRVFSSTTVQKHPFFRAQPHSGTWWPAPHGATTGFSDAGPKASRDWPQNTLLLDFTPWEGGRTRRAVMLLSISWSLHMVLTPYLIHSILTTRGVGLYYLHFSDEQTAYTAK